MHVPSNTYAPGTYGPFTLSNIPGNSPGFTLVFDNANNWSAGDCLMINIEISQDNGATFKPWISVTFQGQMIKPAVVSGEWPGVNDGSGGRRILQQTDVRATAIVLQTITTAITLSFK